MLKFTSTADPRLARFPPEHRTAVQRALATLAAVFGREPDSIEEGFVSWIEPHDVPQVVRFATGRDIDDLEGVFRDGDCLVGILLWGNAGAGVTLVCPDLDGYAPEIVRVLRENL